MVQALCLIIQMHSELVDVVTLSLSKKINMFKLRYIGDPILRRETKKVENFDSSLSEFIKNMVKTMHKEEGIGLAAPQIGHSEKILVVDISGIEGEEFNVPVSFINPEVKKSWGESLVEEGCLSIPEIREDVSRPYGITLKYQDVIGKEFTEDFDGWMARVLQHEIDHLDGKLFLDYISPIKRKLLQEQDLIPEKY